MKHFTVFGLILGVLLIGCTSSFAQKKILIDVAHGQKFYSDPADNISTQLVPTERLKYMTGELSKNAAAHNAELSYLKSAVVSDALAGVDLLFVHVPSTKYTAEECKVIQEYIGKGGSLFFVFEEDYWATLQQLNANDILKPFGITFGENNPDKSVGGHAKIGKVTTAEYKIPFHGARIVDGGTPLATSDADSKPFAVFKEVKGGGKIVAMGEGMVSLYMTSWQDVKDYQCAPFMQDVIGWLVK